MRQPKSSRLTVQARVLPCSVLLVVSALAFAFADVAGAAAASAHARGHRHARVVHRLWVKPQLRGLVDKDQQGPYALAQPFTTADPNELSQVAAAFSGIVVDETWAQLEPSRNQFTLAPLNRSLAAVRAYNRAHRAHPLRVKLRLWGGFTAPQWAKTLGDTTPVTFATHDNETTGRWWTAPYRAAWSQFQHRLAARFDSDPLVASVAVTSCATLTAEPFVQSPSLALHDELFADGWSSTAQADCLKGAFADYSGWRHTPIDFAFNPFTDYVPGKAEGTKDLTVMDELMMRCADLRRSTGRSCILSNHVLTATAPTISRSAPTYAEITALYNRHPAGTPVDLQTGPPNNFGDCAAIDAAIQYHSLSLELWPPSPNPKSFKGFAAYPEGELTSWATALSTQTPLRCPAS
jgi:hypothetical protein